MVINSTNAAVMLKFYTFCLLFIFCVTTWATEYNKSIVWDVDESGLMTSDFSFEGSVILDQSKLPHWIESFEVSSLAPKVFIHDVISEQVSDSMLNLRNDIGTYLNFKTEIGFVDGKSVLRVIVLPYIRKDKHVEKVVEFSISVTEDNQRLKSAVAGYSWKDKSVLASGKWVKIKTTGKGIYKITFDQLKQWGFSSPDLVSVYGNGGYMLPEMNSNIQFDDLVNYPILKGKDSGGKDAYFFYSTGNVQFNIDSKTGVISHKQNFYSTETYFYLTDQGTANVIGKSAEIKETAGRQVSSYNNYAFYEKELNNVLSSGSRWFGEKFNPGQSMSFSLNLDNPDLTKNVQYVVAAVGRSAYLNYMDVNVNGSSKSNIEFYPVPVTDPEAYYAADKKITFSDQISSKTVPVKLTYTASTSTSNAWLDYVSVNYQSLLAMNSDVIFFRGKGVDGTTSVSEFTLTNATANTRILDVTDMFGSSEVQASYSGGQIKFKSNSSDYREYVAFNTDGTISTPEKVGDISNQNLHGNSTPDMVIVTSPDFESVANSIADFHATNDNLTVEVVTPDKIYNEFSGGMPDPAAIRNYFRMYYDRGTQSGGKTLKYALLLGDGSYDNRNILGKKLNLLPTYQADNSLSPTDSFVTDDFYAFLDQGEGGSQGIVDIGIGRIPANTTDQAKAVLEKILNYYKSTTLGNWRSVLTFIADDEDDNTHMIQAEDLANFVNNNYPEFYTDKIYLDAYKQVSSSSGESYPDVSAAITNRIKQGTLVMNYTGHANERYLAAENVLDISTIQSWSNFNKLPVFVTATCEFSRFDADETSAGEEILFNSQGGGIGLFSTTRLVWSGANFQLNRKFFDYIFGKDSQGNNLRLGDIMQKAKAAANTGINQLNFTLLADPALRLANPQLQVKTATINGFDVDAKIDTIRPLSVVTIKGYIADFKGAKVTSFNGELVPAVYDKAQTVETLGNAGQTPMSYKVQTNLIYKGLVTVKNGEFEFSFIVPKDVAFKLDKGKILYYAYNETTDAKGAFDGFLVGGSSSKTITDAKGPEVALFMNSEKFRDGDEVGATSVLIANISDETGINTSGIGIGHDITAVLDGDYANIMVLNDYFQGDKDAYRSGKVLFPLSGLSEGEHTITFKVWDVLNNSTEVEIHFVVKDIFRIESVNSYPNPMQGQTSLVFSHNYPDESFDIRVDVFQIDGAMIDSFSTKVGSSGTSSLPISWIPADRHIRMRAGVYLYRISATSTTGKTATGSGKLVYIYP